jgi:16S rRNA U516 pseudouridylate synthase RsuA-like enzyme
MGSLTGLPVLRIIRIRIGEITLGNLKPGEWRYLTPAEVKKLKNPNPKTFTTKLTSR